MKFLLSIWLQIPAPARHILFGLFGAIAFAVGSFIIQSVPSDKATIVTALVTAALSWVKDWIHSKDPVAVLPADPGNTGNPMI